MPTFTRLAARRFSFPSRFFAFWLIGLCAVPVPGVAATIWSNTATPAQASVSDPNAVELGVKFHSDVDGTVTGIRFYKGTSNSGTHVGHLWTANGALLASATFSGESATGWQQVSFSAPIAITANTTYIASYYAPNGNYAANNDYFASQSFDNAPLHAESGANGVYLYGQSAFPSSSYRSTNYWVDVVFDPGTAPPPTAAAILVITSAGNPFTQYNAEILRAEGLNAFVTADIATVTSATLPDYDVAILGEMPLTSAQVAMFSSWVEAGGNLIAMRPDKQLADLLGLTDSASTLSDAYLLVAQTGPGLGIVNQTIQFHDAADRYTLNGATALATLYADASTATTSPAVTVRRVGAGSASAFAYDLAKSVIRTRQGNPAWAGQERDGPDSDGITRIRPDDLFYPDYVNLAKVAIPQADEQQRLLANLITQANLAKKPLPRFWYLPNGLKAAIVHALDDHNPVDGSGNPFPITQITFDKFNAASASGCSVDDWQCLRATSWAYVGIPPLTDAQAASYVTQGFEFGVHVQNGCTNFTSFSDLNATYVAQLQQFRSTYPSVPPQSTHRYHCIIWSDWATQAKAALANGIRYSMDYYYWPAAWVQNRPGFFTGSGIPMRFADLDGTILDIYQGVSQLVNENGMSYPGAINAMLDRALGAEGYYGLFGTHDDYRDSIFSDGVISAATSHNVPTITAKQALDWLDGRNGSSFGALAWDGSTLAFTVTADARARNLQGMLPLSSTANSLTSITRDGSSVAFTTQTIKGMQYAFFPATNGNYQALYSSALLPPTAGGATLWPASATPTNASVDDTGAVELGVKFQADQPGKIIGIRFYKGAGNSGTHVGNLWTSDGTKLATVTFLNETATGWQQVNFATPVAIAANTPYVASYHTEVGRYAANNNYFAASGVDNAPLHAPSDTAAQGNGVYVYGAGGFPTSTYQATNYWVDVVFVGNAPSSLWRSGTTPANASVNDPSPIELGVKFTSDVPGKVKGIRFYKGAGNTGAHTGTLWTASGAPLATGAFTSETASGWQETLFATPVDIAANTVYVASYFAPAGNYAADSGYFVNAYDNAPLHAPATGASGGNGVYVYGASGFPTSTFNANNYWVDVLFEPAL